MRVYRFEREDGAGPFFDINGNSRGTSFDFKKTNYFWGFVTLKSLKEYFDKRQELIKDCKLIVYDIPFNCIHFETETKVSFPKKYKINGKEIKIDLWKYCN